jgi:hypothetical protein
LVERKREFPAQINRGGGVVQTQCEYAHPQDYKIPLCPRCPPMGLFDVLIHIVNFFMPALGMALILPSLVRLIWFKKLRSVGWRLMASRVALAGAAVLVAGLVVLGRDGAMWTYTALVLASAGVVWWTAFRGRA